MSADERSRDDHRSGRGRKEQVNVSKLHLHVDGDVMSVKVKVKNYEKQQGSIPRESGGVGGSRGEACPSQLGLCKSARAGVLAEGFANVGALCRGLGCVRKRSY